MHTSDWGFDDRQNYLRFLDDFLYYDEIIEHSTYEEGQF